MSKVTPKSTMMRHAQIFHRFGGEITRVHAVGHETVRGIASWHYVCDVAWNDGSKSEYTFVAPGLLCHDSDVAGSHERVILLSNALHAYLAIVGVWHEAKRKRDGRVYTWTPHKPEGSQHVGV